MVFECYISREYLFTWLLTNLLLELTYWMKHQHWLHRLWGPVWTDTTPCTFLNLDHGTQKVSVFQTAMWSSPRWLKSEEVSDVGSDLTPDTNSLWPMEPLCLLHFRARSRRERGNHGCLVKFPKKRKTQDYWLDPLTNTHSHKAMVFNCDVFLETETNAFFFLSFFFLMWKPDPKNIRTWGGQIFFFNIHYFWPFDNLWIQFTVTKTAHTSFEDFQSTSSNNNC